MPVPGAGQEMAKAVKTRIFKVFVTGQYARNAAVSAGAKTALEKQFANRQKESSPGTLCAAFQGGLLYKR